MIRRSILLSASGSWWNILHAIFFITKLHSKFPITTIRAKIWVSIQHRNKILKISHKGSPSAQLKGQCSSLNLQEQNRVGNNIWKKNRKQIRNINSVRTLKTINHESSYCKYSISTSSYTSSAIRSAFFIKGSIAKSFTIQNRTKMLYIKYHIYGALNLGT